MAVEVRQPTADGKIYPLPNNSSRIFSEIERGSMYHTAYF